MLIRKLGIDFNGRCRPHWLLSLQKFTASLLDFRSRLAEPFGEVHLHAVLHPVGREEESGHRVQQVLINLKVFLVFDQFELELLLNRLVLESGIAIQIVNEFIEKVIGLGCCLGVVIHRHLGQFLRVRNEIRVLVFVVVLLILLNWGLVIQDFNISFLYTIFTIVALSFLIVRR